MAAIAITAVPIVTRRTITITLAGTLATSIELNPTAIDAALAGDVRKLAIWKTSTLRALMSKAFTSHALAYAAMRDRARISVETEAAVGSLTAKVTYTDDDIGSDHYPTITVTQTAVASTFDITITCPHSTVR